MKNEILCPICSKRMVLLCYSALDITNAEILDGNQYLIKKMANSKRTYSFSCENCNASIELNTEKDLTGLID
jgi:hypothetical protein